MNVNKQLAQRKPVLLAGFIAASLVAHGLVFLIETNSSRYIAQPSLGTQQLNISLVKATSEPKKQPKAIKKPAKKVNRHEEIPSTNPRKINQNSANKNAEHNYLLGEIKHRLSRYLTYPVRARKRGWQGDVLIGLQIDKKGFLHGIHLSQSSGYALLDNAALSAIEKVKFIPLTPLLKQALNQNLTQNGTNGFPPTALQLPVSYQLTNS